MRPKPTYVNYQIESDMDKRCCVSPKMNLIFFGSVANFDDNIMISVCHDNVIKNQMIISFCETMISVCHDYDNQTLLTS